MLAGLAADGGLYVPETWPAIDKDAIAALAGLPYAEAAHRIIRPFLDASIDEEEFKALLHDAYRPFRHAATAPLVQIAPRTWILELFHGPTLAFKDFAMQLLAPLIERALARRGGRATLLGATSGDTGGAAIEAFRGRRGIDIFILHPKGRVSEVQRRQMTTAVEDNVHNIAVEGTFDDCQALVKAMFNDRDLRERLSLAGVNSINWARIMAQIVYYFTAAVALGAPRREVCFCVPTGNFGDIFAGYAARRMGLPIRRLVIATNVNDILARTLASGRYEPKGVVATSSPSMDIQVASNFERLLFEAADRDGGRVGALMEALARTGAFQLSDRELHAMRALFAAARTDEEGTRATIARLAAECGYVADPHTAVGVAAAWRQDLEAEVPIIALATAHPAKFPDAVGAATGCAPALPERLASQLEAEERYTVMPNDVRAIARYIEQHARAAAETSP